MGWDTWHPQYDLPLGAPQGDASVDLRGVMGCPDGTATEQRFTLRNATLSTALNAVRRRGSFESSHDALQCTAPVLEWWSARLRRTFASGTAACLTLEAGSLGPGVPCIHWGTGRVDGPSGCTCTA